MGNKISRIKDIGKTYNYLTIIDIVKDDDYIQNVKFLCKCICGESKIIRNNNLKYNKTKSCGCKNYILREFNIKTFRKEPGHSTFLNLYKCYIKSSKTRGHSFNLTQEQFKFLTKQNCYYCNKKPENKHIIKSKDKEWQNKNTYIYNGIDRLNNNLGYEINNCVSCCKFCNQAKMNYSKEEFLENIKQIYLNSIEVVIEKL